MASIKTIAESMEKGCFMCGEKFQGVDSAYVSAVRVHLTGSPKSSDGVLPALLCRQCVLELVEQQRG